MSDVVELGGKPGKSETVPLFEVDGTTYGIPAKPKLGVAVRFLQGVANGGGLLAELALLEELLGAEAYQVLMDQDVDGDQLKALISAAEKAVLGGLETAGNPPSGSAKSAG